MSRGGAALAALLATLGRPSWWVLALAAFLLRGGLLLLLLPIVLIPSPLAISNAAAPLIVPIALGRVGPEFLVIAGAGLAAFFGWLLIGGYVAAAAEATLIRDATEAAAEEGVPIGRDEDADDRGIARRVLAARLVALIPFAVAVAVGAVAIVGVTYTELTRPVDTGTALAVRVARGAVWQLVAIALSWVLAEVLGGAAARRIVLDGGSAAAGLVAAASDLVRRPRSTLIPWLATTAVLLVASGAVLGASSVSWRRLQEVLADATADPISIAIGLLTFVAVWVAALVLIGFLAAGRTAIGAFELLRVRAAVPARPGTFGAGAHGRPGDWSVGGGSGSL